MVFIWDLKNAIWMDEQSRAGNTCVPINLHDIRRDFVSPECVSAMNHTARSISSEWNFPSESTWRWRRRRRTFVPRVVQSGSEFSSAALLFQRYFFLQEKQFYAEFILLHIHKSEKETKKNKKQFRYFPSVTWLSQNLKRHKVDSAGPSKCDLKKIKNSLFSLPVRCWWVTFLPGTCVQLWAGEFTAAHHETPPAPWWLTSRNTFPNLPGETQQLAEHFFSPALSHLLSLKYCFFIAL